MMTCKDFENLVVDYLEAGQASRRPIEFARHIRICHQCSDYLAAYARTIELTRAISSRPAQFVADDATEDLIRTILNRRER